MGKEIESYKIGKISVVISETEEASRLKVECNDGTFRSGFTVSRYEYNHYRRHMNQKILNAYKEGHAGEE